MNSKNQNKGEGKYTKLSVRQQLTIKGGRVPGDKPKRPQDLRPPR